MRFTSVGMLAVVVILMGLGGCYYQDRFITVDTTYEEESDGTIAPVPSGTRMVIECHDYDGPGADTSTLRSERDNGLGRYTFYAIGVTSGDCRFWTIELPGEYGEKDVFECDPAQSENCEFELAFYGGDYYVGDVNFSFLCHYSVEDCEQWCDAHEDISCPGSECDACISDCSSDQC